MSRELVPFDDHDLPTLLGGDAKVWGILVEIYNRKEDAKLEDIFNKGFSDNSIYRLLRSRFWEHLNHCRKVYGSVMDFHYVHDGICSSNEFSRFLEDELFCKYILIPKIEYNLELSSLLDQYGVKFYIDVLSASDVKPNGNPLSFADKMKLNKFKFEILKRLEERVYGGTINRIESKSANLIKLDNSSVDDELKDLSLKEIKRELAELSSDVLVPSPMVSNKPENKAIDYNENTDIEKVLESIVDVTYTSALGENKDLISVWKEGTFDIRGDCRYFQEVGQLPGEHYCLFNSKPISEYIRSCNCMDCPDFILNDKRD